MAKLSTWWIRARQQRWCFGRHVFRAQRVLLWSTDRNTQHLFSLSHFFFSMPKESHHYLLKTGEREASLKRPPPREKWPLSPCLFSSARTEQAARRTEPGGVHSFLFYWLTFFLEILLMWRSLQWPELPLCHRLLVRRLSILSRFKLPRVLSYGDLHLIWPDHLVPRRDTCA